MGGKADEIGVETAVSISGPIDVAYSPTFVTDGAEGSFDRHAGTAEEGIALECVDGDGEQENARTRG